MIKNKNSIRILLCKCWATGCMTAALGCVWCGLLALCEALTGGGVLYIFPVVLAIVGANTCLGGYYTARIIETEQKGVRK